MSVSSGIARHQEIAARQFRGGRADCVLEVRPAESERAAQHGTVDGSDFRHRKQIRDQATGERIPSLARRQVVNGRHAVRGQQDGDAAAISQAPELRRRGRERRPPQDEIENHVDVQEEPFQRYLRATPANLGARRTAAG